ncbi:hypothetical protein [Duganella vulcania]|uniref:Uncharacterized protein n=1 Tax=Duganella vulcania TaxID=2692166 RepID=A0A845GI07_9BURK|nr:hypothetical protein [Duganella vulcania]MYM92688.1 hypothetical protein [Duganella vulcania]
MTTLTPNDPDYWYVHKHELEPGMVFRTTDNSLVKLDGRVPGDGTQWYVAEWCGGSWAYMDSKIEPGELIGLPQDDPAGKSGAAR